MGENNTIELEQDKPSNPPEVVDSNSTDHSEESVHISDRISIHGSRPGSYRVVSPEKNHTQCETQPVDHYSVDGKPPPVTSVLNIDLQNRDPAQINQHLKVAFEEVFAEPHATIHSFDAVWEISFRLFTLVKLWTYRILSMLCAIPAAMCWALYFACMAFCQIWCCMPFYRQFMIILGMAKQFFEVLTSCCIAPICMAIGKVLSSIRVTVVKTRDYYSDLHQI